MQTIRILITGGNGFIARNLSEGLGGEYEISAPNSKELNLLDSDRVFDCLKQGGFDIVVHAATYDAAPKHSVKDPAKVMENNLKMFFNLARCNNYFGKMLYFGSGAEFCREHWVPKMKEDYFDRHLPSDQYGFSKYIMNKYAQSGRNIYNLRLFAVFGKYEDWRVRFISNACCSAILDMPIVINRNNSFDFLYITDLVNIVRWFIDNTPFEKAYNVCTGRPVDFLAVAKKILKISGKHLDIVVKNDHSKVEYSADNSRLLGEIKGYRFMDLDKAIGELYAWWLNNQRSFDKEKLLASYAQFAV